MVQINGQMKKMGRYAVIRNCASSGQLRLLEVSADTSSESISNTDTFKFWGCSASITGNVAASQSRTRSTDSSAKYQIHARAVQQAPSEGMAKLTALFASAMEPIEKKDS